MALEGPPAGCRPPVELLQQQPQGDVTREDGAGGPQRRLEGRRRRRRQTLGLAALLPQPAQPLLRLRPVLARKVVPHRRVLVRKLCGTGGGELGLERANVPISSKFSEKHVDSDLWFGFGLSFS